MMVSEMAWNAKSRAQTPPERRGSDDIQPIPWASCFLWKTFQMPITIWKTQSVVATPEILGHFSTMTQHFFAM